MIYIDTPVEYSGVPHEMGGRKFKSSHLMSDKVGQEAVEELLAFAKKIGLNTRWIQDTRNPIYVHFDVMNNYYQKALAAGAIPLTPKDLARVTVQKKEKYKQECSVA